MIHFDKLNSERPIRYDWRGLKKLEKKENSIANSEIHKESSVDIENETIDKDESSSGSNQEIEREEIKEDTFLTNMKNIFRLKK